MISLQSLVTDLVNNADLHTREHTHRCAAEIVAALIRGSAHWSYGKVRVSLHRNYGLLGNITCCFKLSLLFWLLLFFLHETAAAALAVATAAGAYCARHRVRGNARRLADLHFFIDGKGLDWAIIILRLSTGDYLQSAASNC